MHEPGSKTVLGKTYREAGEAEGEAVLRDLAAHPSTARFVATKSHSISRAAAGGPRRAPAREVRRDRRLSWRPSIARLVESPEPWDPAAAGPRRRRIS
jgi:uncharacterized protein (DUF1800 family)